jgi:ParB-like chromosome segregation protein Spo0J
MRLKEMAQSTAEVYFLSPDDIAVDSDFNVREDTEAVRDSIAAIRDSIVAIGFMSTRPLTVRLDKTQGKAVLVDGHCRFAAVKMAIADGHEIRSVPCLSEGRGVSPEDRIVMMLNSNTGLPLSNLEQARAVKRLLGFGWTENEIGRQIGRSRQHVANLLELAAAPNGVKAMIVSGVVSATEAVKAIRAEGSNAEAMLRKAEERARAAGKTHVTPKIIREGKSGIAPRPAEPAAPRVLQVAAVPLSVAAQYVVDAAKGLVLPSDLRRAIDALHVALT